MQEYKADVVIIGGGIAGISAAIELLNEGKKIILLDRDIEKGLGGLARLTGTSLNWSVYKKHSAKT